MNARSHLVMGCCTLILTLVLGAGGLQAAVPADLPARARLEMGERGAQAAEFLLSHMPAADRAALSAEFVLDHLRLALSAREEFPWARTVPDPLFFNDVVPYAVFDEPREAWRADFLARARTLVAGCRTATEAAQALNRGLFNNLNVHYHTGRRAPNQGASESLALGKASCSGLSILFVYACRAVGIPARAVGTPLWVNQSGNHTWVEVWDGDWHFTGADEYDAQGLDRGWFVAEAARARSDLPQHGIYATSWAATGVGFPLVWAPTSTAVHAVPVTQRYARAAVPAADAGVAHLGLRLFDRPGGERLVARVSVLAADGSVLGELVTRAGTSDLNDVPRLTLPAGTSGRLRFVVGDTTRERVFGPLTAGDPLLDCHWDSCQVPPGTAPSADALAPLVAWLALPVETRPADAAALRLSLSKADALRARVLLADDRQRLLAEQRQEALRSRTLAHAGKTMRWHERTFGKAPASGASLWISLHGGGGAPPQVNDEQWENQRVLYQPTEGIYVAPRAPTDTWNLWHEAHIDGLLGDLIETYVAARGVDPDKVYLMGYSAGGDGVWQLAPRMADRFAAAAMMAGHPNEASLLGLRNLPFAIFMGGKDAAYDRNRIAAERGAELARLRQADPDGYTHLLRIYAGMGHWMDRRDAEALPWMQGFSRRTWPRRVVWFQDDVTHARFYWLSLGTPAAAKAGQQLSASVEGNRIALTGDVPAGLRLHLDDELLDLDRPVVVTVQGMEVWSGIVPRTAGAVLADLSERADRRLAGCALLTLPER